MANRLQVDDDGVLVDYSPGDGQQLTNPMNRYEAVDGISLSYDLRGNTLSDGIISYTYDILNRQIGMSGSSGGAEYVFNAFGYRVASIVDSTVTYYVYDNQGQVLEERDGTDSLTARYTYGPDIDQPVTMERGGVTYYYHRDGQNSITELTDAAGDLVEHYRYDIYGRASIFAPDESVLDASAVGNPYLYTGRRFDPESGNYTFRARMYSPVLGRFLQVDPLGYTDGLNNYANYFVINDIDPYGTFLHLALLADLTSGIPDINVSAGISIVAKSPPIIGPAGLFIKMETKFTLGTCCANGKIKNFVKHDVTVLGGVHVGMPGISIAAAIQTTVNFAGCPKEAPFDCQGIFEASVTLGPVTGTCSMKSDGSWSCGIAGGGLSGGYGSSGLSGGATATSTPPPATGTPSPPGLSVGGGITCTKAVIR